MHVKSLSWTPESGWTSLGDGEARAPDWLLFFAAPDQFRHCQRIVELKARFPGVPFVGASTGGEIFGTEVHEDSVVAAAVWFAHTRVQVVAEAIGGPEDSEACGQRLAKRFSHNDLRGLFVLSDGTSVNGSDLLRGLHAGIGAGVTIFGGLAGDGAEFKKTYIDVDSPRTGQVAAVGFYSQRLHIECGSFGGWVPFGPERRVTKAVSNVLYELDGEPALDLYKRYLGDEARRLPASALLFPLRVKMDDSRILTRTIVGVDELARTMTFAGDVPIGAVVQLMRSTIERLVEGAEQAADQIKARPGERLSILVSCIGRRLVLGQRTADEVEAVADRLGVGNVQIGFYSYGELSPLVFVDRCELHNQTMTIATISES